MNDTLNLTIHAIQRFSQRGISKSLAWVAYQFGRVKRDKYILDKKTINQTLTDLDKIRTILLKAMDKGGLVIVMPEDTVITAYGLSSYKRPYSCRQSRKF
jgi:hypothetical protein